MKAANEFYWVLLLIISVLGLLGVIFLCIGTALYAREKRKRASCTQQVIASVTDIQHRAEPGDPPPNSCSGQFPGRQLRPHAGLCPAAPCSRYPVG